MFLEDLHVPSTVLVIKTFIEIAAAKSLWSCPTLCGPTDGSPPGSPVPGVLQARTLEWAAISFSNAGKWKVKVKSLSRVQPSATPWTAAHQAPLPIGFSRQEYWSGVPLSSPPSMATSPKIGITPPVPSLLCKFHRIPDICLPYSPPYSQGLSSTGKQACLRVTK